MCFVIVSVLAFVFVFGCVDDYKVPDQLVCVFVFVLGICECACVCIHVSVGDYKAPDPFVYVCVLCVSISISVSVSISVSIFDCVCVCVCVCVCICVCICICVRISRKISLTFSVFFSVLPFSPFSFFANPFLIHSHTVHMIRQINAAHKKFVFFFCPLSPPPPCSGKLIHSDKVLMISFCARNSRQYPQEMLTSNLASTLCEDGNIRLRPHTHTHAHTHTHTYISIYVYVNICIYTHIYIYICIHVFA